MSVTVHAAKDWPFLDPGMGQPVGEVTNWAPASAAIRDGDLAPLPGLICFGATEMQHDPLSDMLNITAIEPDQLGSAERPREPDQQQCPNFASCIFSTV